MKWSWDNMWLRCFTAPDPSTFAGAHGVAIFPCWLLPVHVAHWRYLFFASIMSESPLISSRNLEPDALMHDAASQHEQQPECLGDPVDAAAPFNRPNADVILRTSDNVDFRFYKLLLSLASPFFANMFALPQPCPLDKAADQTKYGLPVIPVAEKSHVLQKLLSFCSPVYDIEIPVLENLDIVMSVLDAADKYDMKCVGKFVVKMITAPEFLEQEPMRVFAIACRYRAEAETNIAARYMLRFAVWEPAYVSELDFISGSDYQRLVKYHASCGQAMSQLVRLWSLFPLPPLDCKFCRKNGLPRLSLKSYQDSVIDALRVRPCAETLMNPEWIEGMVRKAGSCQNCRDRAPRNMAAYAKELAVPINEIISDVCAFIRSWYSLLSFFIRSTWTSNLIEPVDRCELYLIYAHLIETLGKGCLALCMFVCTLESTVVYPCTRPGPWCSFCFVIFFESASRLEILNWLWSLIPSKFLRPVAMPELGPIEHLSLRVVVALCHNDAVT